MVRYSRNWRHKCAEMKNNAYFQDWEENAGILVFILKYTKPNWITSYNRNNTLIFVHFNQWSAIIKIIKWNKFTGNAGSCRTVPVMAEGYSHWPTALIRCEEESKGSYKRNELHMFPAACDIYFAAYLYYFVSSIFMLSYQKLFIQYTCGMFQNVQ